MLVEIYIPYSGTEMVMILLCSLCILRNDWQFLFCYIKVVVIHTSKILLIPFTFK